MAIYNETNLTEVLSRPLLRFNDTMESSWSINNGTGHYVMGYTNSFCRVEGFDILLQLNIVMTILLFILTFFIVFYVSMYFMRWLYD